MHFLRPHTDLDLQKLVLSKQFSQTPRSNQNDQHISLNKLTGGYKNLSGRSYAIDENVKLLPEISVTQSTSVTATAGEECYLDGGHQNRLYKSCPYHKRTRTRSERPPEKFT